MNELKQDQKAERTPKQEKIDSATRASVIIRLQEQLETVLVNPANSRIKENLAEALTSNDEATANIAFMKAREGLMQRGVLTWPRLHALIAECKKSKGQEE